MSPQQAGQARARVPTVNKLNEVATEKVGAALSELWSSATGEDGDEYSTLEERALDRMGISHMCIKRQKKTPVPIGFALITS